MLLNATAPGRELLQFGVFGFGLLQDGDVGSGTLQIEGVNLNARIDGGKELGAAFCFTTTRQVRSKYDVRHVRIVNAGDKDESFPVLKISQLTPKARKWLKIARRTLREQV